MVSAQICPASVWVILWVPAEFRTASISILACSKGADGDPTGVILSSASPPVRDLVAVAAAGDVLPPVRGCAGSPVPGSGRPRSPLGRQISVVRRTWLKNIAEPIRFLHSPVLGAAGNG